MERFIKISGYDNYSVSNKGRVRNDKSGRILKPRVGTSGYLQVNPCKDGKSQNKSVHRLVAEAFIPNPKGLSEVNHINEDKTDNRVENLEWCDRQHNVHHGTGIERMRLKQPHSKCCVVDNVVYVSVRSAERQLGIPRDSLKCALRRGLSSYKNHTISYIN